MCVKEHELIEKFCEQLIVNGVDQNTIKTAKNNESKIMDVNFICPITNEYISLEAKTFGDIRSNSNFFLSLFGKILKGRHLNKKNKDCQDKTIEYGFLFDASNKEMIGHYFSIIEEEDWKKFCKFYDVKYVFVRDNDNYMVYEALKYKNIIADKEDKNYFCKNKIIDEEESDL